jgi:hypothetical protein
VRSRSALLVVALSVALAALYLLATPHTTDLAAQTARAELFRRSGFVPYWAGWYSGVTTTSYSLVTPPLLGLFGAVWLGAISVVATALVVVPLLRDSLRPHLGAAAFAVAAYLDVFSGRTTFAVGAVVALGAVLAIERQRAVLAGVLGLVATATSPVAGFLLLIVVAALVLSDSARRRAAIAVAVGVVVMLGGLAILARGDTGGYQPFSTASFLVAAGTAAVVGLSQVSRRLRVGAVVTIVVLLGVYVLHSAIGSNVLRLTVLTAAPTLVAAARLQRWQLGVVIVLAGVAPALQLNYDVRQARIGDTTAAFVAPLRDRLAADPSVRDHRVELVDTASHWPSTFLLPHVALARGWERQTDESRNPIFYGREPLTAASYREFLDRNAVDLVAVAVGVKLDFAAKGENALIAGGLPYLHQIWSAAHWRLYAVADPAPIVVAPATVVSTSDTGLTVNVPAPGSYALALHWSPYLVVSSGDVTRAADGDVDLVVKAAGSHRLHAVWRLP